MTFWHKNCTFTTGTINNAMNRILILCLIACVPIMGKAQSDTSSLLAHIDEVTKNWDDMSEELSTYDGLRMYCRNKSYKEKVLSTLNSIHHYDTVIYNVLVKKQRYKKDKEIDQFLKEIKKFETKFHPTKLISFLHEECSFRKDIEHDKEESKTSFGADSYDGQINILETELYKFVRQITKIVDSIRKHSHHLHLEKYADE